MNAHLHETLKHFGKHLTMALFACAVILLSGAATTETHALTILTGADDSAIVLDKGSVKGLELPEQVYKVAGKDVALNKGQTVTILRGDETITAESKKAEKISSLLKRLDIELNPLEMIMVDVSGTGVTVTIDEDLTYYDKVVEEVPYQTIRVPNPDLLKGTEQVVRQGVNGGRTAIYEVIWANGEQVSRQFVEDLGTSTVDEIIEYGTSADEIARSDRITNIVWDENGGGVLEFQSGSTLKFTGTRDMIATAYTAGYGGADYTTATGTFVKTGVAAVDRKVIPLGTRMYIVTNDGIVYGLAKAEDTGVRGNVIDLYHNTYQDCMNFGRRPCTVYILE